MTRPLSVLVAVLAVLLAGAVPAMAGPVTPLADSGSVTPQDTGSLVDTPENETTGNETADNETASGNGSVAPGAQLAGVFGVQGAEVEGEVEQRAFGQRIAEANSNASKASVIAEQVPALEDRLERIRERQAALRAKYENGTISVGQYKARMATLAAEARTLQRLLNRTAQTAQTLPVETLRQQGVNVTALEELRANAANLTGPEVAAIARQIAGPNVGNTPGGPPANVSTGAPNNVSTGPPGGNGAPGNETVHQPGNVTTGAPGNTSVPGNRTTSDAGNQTVNTTTTRPGQGQGSGNGSSGADPGTPGNGTAQGGGFLSWFF